MTRKRDIRTVRTVEDIKSSLLRVLEHKTLAEATVAEVARGAGIGRSTFYVHFASLRDVYDDLVRDFEGDVQTLSEHFGCETCRGDRAIEPMCDRVRHAGRYAGVVADPQFVSAWIRDVPSSTREEYFSRLRAAGLTKQQAEAVFRFHMSGCLAVARSELGEDDSWPEIQRALDAFVSGGLANVGRASGRG